MDGSDWNLWYICLRSIVLPNSWAKHYQYSFLAESKPHGRLFSKRISPGRRRIDARSRDILDSHGPMYCLTLSFVYIKSFLTISGLIETDWSGQSCSQQKLETISTKPVFRSVRPSKQGNYFNETNSNQCHPDRRAESGHGRWSTTLRPRYRSTSS